MSDYSVPPFGSEKDPNVAIVRRFGQAEVATAKVVNGSSNTIHTPATGRRIRLKWIYVATPSSGSETVATIKLGTDIAYAVPLPPPGVFMRTSVREGEADAALVVELTTPTSVYVNYELEEF